MLDIIKAYWVHASTQRMGIYDRKGEEGERKKEVREKKRGRESKERSNSPFYSKPGLPGNSQVTFGWSLEGMPTPCMFLCVLCTCLVPLEARKVYHISLEFE